MANRSTIRLSRLLLIGSGFVFMILSMSVADESKHSDSISEEDESHPEKRYVAALAKNGRLPKFHSSEKKSELDANYDESLSQISDSQDEPWMESKRHIGSVLNRNPDFARIVGLPNDIDRRAVYVDVDAEPSSLGNVDKRNVAALARLGGLNAIRYGQYSGGKRWSPTMNMMNDGIASHENNVISEDSEDDCDGSQDSDGVNSEDNYLQPNWIPSQQKRYIAALARSGRLPVWHPQRMWSSGKRAPKKTRYWIRYRTGARQFGGKRNVDETSDLQVKNKRCKKSSDAEKRNLSALARKGLISSMPSYNAA